MRKLKKDDENVESKSASLKEESKIFEEKKERQTYRRRWTWSDLQDVRERERG